MYVADKVDQIEYVKLVSCVLFTAPQEREFIIQ